MNKIKAAASNPFLLHRQNAYLKKNMMKQMYKILVAVLLFSAGALPAAAQNQDAGLNGLIREKDSLFWQAYNNCDVPGMMQYFADDVEFYHDKGGITTGIEKFTANTKNNLCGKAGFRLRREAIAGTIQIFPMQQAGKLYGAIISGEHLFYINDNGKPEFLDGHARFTHLWLLQNSVWKMSRILSFDHHPAQYQSNRKEIKLAANALVQFEGSYSGKQIGALTVKKEEDHLLLTAGAKTFALFAEKRDTFFTKEKDLTVTFNRNEQSKVQQLVVRENGAVVEEALKQ